MQTSHARKVSLIVVLNSAFQTLWDTNLENSKLFSPMVLSHVLHLLLQGRCVLLGLEGIHCLSPLELLYLLIRSYTHNSKCSVRKFSTWHPMSLQCFKILLATVDGGFTAMETPMERGPSSQFLGNGPKGFSSHTSADLEIVDETFRTKAVCGNTPFAQAATLSSSSSSFHGKMSFAFSQKASGPHNMSQTTTQIVEH